MQMASDHRTPTLVVLRPLGSPLAMGLSGLTVASLVTAGLALGWVARADTAQVGLIILITVVPLQAVAAVFALLARDGPAAGAMGLMAATWAVTGASHLALPPGAHSHATGLLDLAAGGLIILSGTTIARGKLVPGATIATAGAHFVLMGVRGLGGGSGWEHAAGAVSLAVVALAGYCAWAAEVEDMTSGEVTPTGRRDQGKVATSAPYEDQVAGVEHEAGVRRQL